MLSRSSSGRWGNVMGYLLIPFPLQHFPNPLARVSAMKKVLDAKKMSWEGLASHLNARLAVALGGAKVRGRGVENRRLGVHSLCENKDGR